VLLALLSVGPGEARRKLTAAEAVRQLGDPSPGKRAEAALAFWGTAGVRDTAALVPLIQLLGDENRRVRSCAAGALEYVGDARAVEPLIALLGDKSETVKDDAVGALGALQDPRATEPIIAAMEGPHHGAWVRWRYFFALGRIGDRRATPAILAWIRNAANGDDRPAVIVLGNLGDPRAVEALITLAGEPERSMGIHGEIARALGKLGDPRAVPVLIDLFGGSDDARPGYSWAQGAAAVALGRIGDPRAIAPLMAYVQRWYGTVLDSCIVGLGLVGAPAVGPLIEALGTGASSKRHELADALCRIRDPRVDSVLTSALVTEDLAIISGAASWYIARGESAYVPLLLKAAEAMGGLAGGVYLGFINSGQPELVHAGREYCRRQHLTLVPMDGRGDWPAWGSGSAWPPATR